MLFQPRLPEHQELSDDEGFVDDITVVFFPSAASVWNYIIYFYKLTHFIYMHKKIKLTLVLPLPPTAQFEKNALHKDEVKTLQITLFIFRFNSVFL